MQISPINTIIGKPHIKNTPVSFKNDKQYTGQTKNTQFEKNIGPLKMKQTNKTASANFQALLKEFFEVSSQSTISAMTFGIF